MIIKVLFAVLILSAAALIGVAVAVFVRVRWHWKAQHAQVQSGAKPPQESNQEGPT